MKLARVETHKHNRLELNKLPYKPLYKTNLLKADTVSFNGTDGFKKTLGNLGKKTVNFFNDLATKNRAKQAKHNAAYIIENFFDGLNYLHDFNGLIKASKGIVKAKKIMF